MKEASYKTVFDGIQLASSDQRPPEPPVRYTPQPSNSPEPQKPENQYPAQEDFRSIRRYITISQICALVSLVFGGVLLSGAAIAMAVIGYRKAAEMVLDHPEAPIWEALKRSAFIAIGMCVLAFVLNGISLFLLYPMAVDMLQSGDYQSLLGSGASGTSSAAGSGSSTWG